MRFPCDIRLEARHGPLFPQLAPMRPMTPSRPFPAFARKPNWAREMRTPTAREWDQSVNDAKSTKNHCGKLHAAPTWMHLVLNPSYQGGG